VAAQQRKQLPEGRDNGETVRKSLPDIHPAGDKYPEYRLAEWLVMEQLLASPRPCVQSPVPSTKPKNPRSFRVYKEIFKNPP
jgi:hypothetical protein